MTPEERTIWEANAADRERTIDRLDAGENWATRRMLVASKEDIDSPTARKAREVRRYWFDELPDDKADKIIKPAFDAEHPTTNDKRRAVREYENGE